MYFRRIHICDFRNLRSLSYSPHPRFNVISGDNGQGKTNLLEAVFLLATQRSFRSNRPEEWVSFGQEAAEVAADICHAQVERRLSVKVWARPSRKQATVDGKAARQNDYFLGVRVVLFAPEDLGLPKGSPEQRRRFLDRAIWNTQASYLDEIRDYQQVQKSRNAVLRRLLVSAKQRFSAGVSERFSEQTDDNTDAESLLEVYTEQLCRLGARVVARRRDYVKTLSPQMEMTFDRLSRSGLCAGMKYKPKLSLSDVEHATEEDLYQALLEQLEGDRKRDLFRGFTHSGPHADDIEFMLSGREAASHASQGQLRALVLSLKITEIQHLFLLHGAPPVLLLDDVSSELDAQRNAYLFDFLRAMPCQVFITTTSPTFVKLDRDRLDVQMRSGELVCERAPEQAAL